MTPIPITPQFRSELLSLEAEISRVGRIAAGSGTTEEARQEAIRGLMRAEALTRSARKALKERQ